MEPVGAISEGAWNSFNGMCTEEADFMAQLLGNCSLPHDVPNSSAIALSSSFWPFHESNTGIANVGVVDESAMYSSEEPNNNIFSFSQESSYSGGGSNSILFPSSNHDSYYSHQIFDTNNNTMAIDNYVMDPKNNGSRIRILANNVMEGGDFLNQDISNDSMESNENVTEDVLLPPKNGTPISEPMKGDQTCSPSEMTKKRSRLPGDAQRGKRGMKLKKCPNADADDEENNNNNNNNGGAIHRSSSYCSEDDSYASQELNGVASTSSSKGSVLHPNGKTRAGRGSATDPQSLYARKRRERINERLRILQNLVPNGTKVDISTMLEEAVQYVKFLQLQIKLLSSDDLWMYAPIAYNGMDIGLDLKIATPKSQSA